MWHHSKSIEVSANHFNILNELILIEIPASNSRIEEELRLLTDTADGEGTTKRKSARRSFFRRKKHQRSSSRDSKDLSTFSSTQLSWFTDSGIVGEDGTLSSYQRVERCDCELDFHLKISISIISNQFLQKCNLQIFLFF